MKYQRRKQKRTKKTIIVSPYPELDTTIIKNEFIGQHVIKEEVIEDVSMSMAGSDDGDQSSEDRGIEHFLTRRVHPRKGTSKKLFPAHASKLHIS